MTGLMAPEIKLPEVPEVKVTPSRRDVPQIRPRKKASLAEAMRIAKATGPGSDNITEVEEAFSAKSSKASVRSKRETIKAILASLPLHEAPIPLSVYKLKALAAVLIKAGYTSAETYLVEARCMHLEEGWQWTDQLERFFKLVKRACVRGKGPERRAPELRINERWSKKLATSMSAASVWFPNELFVFAASFLLREVELASFCIESIVIDRDIHQVTLRWDVSKMELSCQCRGKSCEVNWPVRVAESLVAKHCAKKLDPSGLCWTRKGNKATKAQIVKTWCNTYNTKLTGHSPRRSGTMRYLREGRSIAQVAYLGRWKSSVVRRRSTGRNASLV